jgi:hypothetical protein
MKILAAIVLALAFAAPAAASPRLSPAERAAITRSVDTFVNHAVKRNHPELAYDVVAPELRPGMTRREWRGHDIPVYPFPATGTTHPWNVLYVTKGEVGLELQLMPPPHSAQGPIIFHIYLRPAHGRWLVDSFMPVATLAPVGAKHSKVRSVRDFSPQNAGGAGLGIVGHGQIDRIWIVAPFAAIGLFLLGLAGWGVARAVRNRRLYAAHRSRALPPLPRNGA